tara:strand:+ start:523 stop:900 length:378 start_codon:yes stop_codon:yes gene_type:complete
MIAAFIPAIIGLIGKGIDKAVPDKDEAERLKAQITLEAMKSDGAELQSATSIILAEANGDSWLQRNWRPLLMLWFAALVGAHWLGFTPENLSDAVVQDLLGIVQVGIGGYVLGRSAEKVVKEYKR